MASARKFDQSKVGCSICFDNKIPPWQHDLSSKDILSRINFTNIFWAAFAPKSFRQKITKPNYIQIVAAQITFVWKSCCKILVKLTPGMSNVFELTCLLINEFSSSIITTTNQGFKYIQPHSLSSWDSPHAHCR